MPVVNDCIFCKEIASSENFFAHDPLFIARRDNFPASPGHVEIVPKRHIQYFEELNQEELSRMMTFAKEVIQQLRKELPMTPDAFNIGINDGVAAGQSVPHLHLHLIPRYEGDVDNPRGGIRRIFPDDSYSNTRPA